MQGAYKLQARKQIWLKNNLGPGHCLVISTTLYLSLSFSFCFFLSSLPCLSLSLALPLSLFSFCQMETIKAGHMEASQQHSHVTHTLEPYLRLRESERQMSDHLKKEGTFVVPLGLVCVCACMCVFWLTVSSPAVSHVSVSDVVSRPGGGARRSLTVLGSLFWKCKENNIKHHEKNQLDYIFLNQISYIAAYYYYSNIICLYTFYLFSEHLFTLLHSMSPQQIMLQET